MQLEHKGDERVGAQRVGRQVAQVHHEVWHALQPQQRLLVQQDQRQRRSEEDLAKNSYVRSAITQSAFPLCLFADVASVAAGGGSL